MSEGRVSGRSAATSIDGAEHGATLHCVMGRRLDRIQPKTNPHRPIEHCCDFHDSR